MDGSERGGGRVWVASSRLAHNGAAKTGKKGRPKVAVPVPVPSGGRREASDGASALDRKGETRPGYTTDV